MEKQVHGKVSFYTKRKKGHLAYCICVLDCVRWSSRCCDLGWTADCGHTNQLHHATPILSVPLHILHKFVLHVKSAFFGCKLLWLRNFDLRSTFVQNRTFLGFVGRVNFYLCACPARSTRNPRFCLQGYSSPKNVKANSAKNSMNWF